MMKGVYGYDVRNGGYEGNKEYYSKNGYNYSYKYSDKQIYSWVGIGLLLLIGIIVVISYNRSQKGKRVALYKFDVFKESLSEYNLMPEIAGDESFLRLRENITNGVETIGHFEYSIHDHFLIVGEKRHNYFFLVNVKLKGCELVERSREYFESYTTELCKIEIATLKKLITDNEEYKRAYNLNQLK